MNKTIKTVSLAVVALVVIYLAYQVLEWWMRPCEGIFQQSSVTLGTKLDVIKAKGEFAIGRQKIQDLTDRSQEMAVNLKACCIVLGKASSEFLRCKEGFDKYDADINKLISSVREAEAAKQQGNAAVVNQRVAEAKQNLNAAEASARAFTRQIAEIKEKPPTEGQFTSAADCCRSFSNAELKSLGRIVVSFPAGSKTGGTRIDIFKADDKNAIMGGYGTVNADLFPGQYDVAVGGRRVKGVEVRAAYDTKIRVGALRVRAGSGTRVDIFERGKTDALIGFYGSKDTGLPVGGYEVQVAGQRAAITIEEDAITQF